VVNEEGWVGIPVDRVKPKSSVRLQRISNLERDPRAALLIDQWDRDDWSQLWWVRASLQWEDGANPQREVALATMLARRFRQYVDRPFDRILMFRVVEISGRSAAN
jgi:hypothetical protein